MKGQKESVIDEVVAHQPTFQMCKDNAILTLSAKDLESIKSNIFTGIVNGTIEYSKDRTKIAEVRLYARSMVMNHLKKAKELNGGNVYINNSSVVHADSNALSVKPVRTKVKVAPKGVDPSLLPEELQEYVKTLI